MTTKIVTEEFEIGHRKHKGATKPKLPVWSFFDDEPEVTTVRDSLGRIVANDVPLPFADFLQDAVNMHDELVECLQLAVDNIQGIADHDDIPSTWIRARARQLIARAKG